MKRSTWGDMEEIKTWLSRWMIEITITYISNVHHFETSVDILVLLLPLINTNIRLIWLRNIVWHHSYWPIRSTLRLRPIDTYFCTYPWIFYFGLNLLFVIFLPCPLYVWSGFNQHNLGAATKSHVCSLSKRWRVYKVRLYGPLVKQIALELIFSWWGIICQHIQVLWHSWA